VEDDMKRLAPSLAACAGALIFAAALASASAQTAPSTKPEGPPAPGESADLLRWPETRGAVLCFTLTPRGEVDGFLLEGGDQAHVPPHLVSKLATMLRPGDVVSVRGPRALSAPLFFALIVTNLTTKETVVDHGPPPAPPRRPSATEARAEQISTTARVERPLYGPAGHVNGAILDDGAMLRLPRPAAARYGRLIVPGRVVSVQGRALDTPYGRVLAADALSLAEPSAPSPPTGPDRP
jgi:hypothetical protein